MSLTEDIKQKAFQLGFDLVGITNVSPIGSKQVEFLAGWLKAGYAAQMNYMHRNFHKRIDPGKLLEGAKSVICVGINYKPAKTQSEPPACGAPVGRIANYALYEDYHPFMKKQLRKLVDFITFLVGRDFEFKICVDSAPLAERAFAARAGLGFIGRNHMLINPELGAQIFLGEIIIDLRLRSDEPTPGGCSGCNKCIEACPTGALRDDGKFDATKCISYLTIEHKGQIPADLAERLGNWLFGCDECVLVCPYQDHTPVCKNRQFKFYGDRASLSLKEVLNLGSESFEAGFADSVIKRSGLERLKRNARICLANIAGRKA